jgi:hypothetical protein
MPTSKPKPAAKPKPVAKAEPTAEAAPTLLLITEPAPASNKPTSAMLLEDALTALPTLVEDAFDAPDDMNTQALLRAYGVIRNMKSMAEKAEERLKDFIVMREKLPQEPGPLRMVIVTAERTSVKWKDEAIVQAAIVAKCKGVPFNPTEYEVATAKKYPANPTRSIKIEADLNYHPDPGV